MGIEFDWNAIQKAGVVGICIVILIVGYKLFTVFIQQWQNSTDAVNKNTTAFNELSNVFKQSSQREIEWQDKAMEIMKDTNKKVKDIHDKVV